MPTPPTPPGLTTALTDWVDAKNAWKTAATAHKIAAEDVQAKAIHVRSKVIALRQLLEDEGKEVPADLRILTE